MSSEQKTALQLAAEKIMQQADERIAQKGYYEIHSCDTWSYGWNKDEHHALLALYRSQPKGYHMTHRVRHQVDEWVIIKDNPLK